MEAAPDLVWSSCSGSGCPVRAAVSASVRAAAAVASRAGAIRAMAFNGLAERRTCLDVTGPRASGTRSPIADMPRHRGETRSLRSLGTTATVGATKEIPGTARPFRTGDRRIGMSGSCRHRGGLFQRVSGWPLARTGASFRRHRANRTDCHRRFRRRDRMPARRNMGGNYEWRSAGTIDSGEGLSQWIACRPIAEPVALLLQYGPSEQISSGGDERPDGDSVDRGTCLGSKHQRRRRRARQ